MKKTIVTGLAGAGICVLAIAHPACSDSPTEDKPQPVLMTVGTPLNRSIYMQLWATENHAPAGQHYYYHVGDDRLEQCGHLARVNGVIQCDYDLCANYRSHGVEGAVGWTVAIQYDPTPTSGTTPPACGTASIAIRENPGRTVTQLKQGAGVHAISSVLAGYCAKYDNDGTLTRARTCVATGDIRFAGNTTSAAGSAGAIIGYAAKHGGSDITVTPSVSLQVGLGPNGGLSFSSSYSGGSYGAGYHILCNYSLRQENRLLIVEEQCGTGFDNKQVEDTSVRGVVLGDAPSTDGMPRRVLEVPCPEGST